MNKTVLKPCRLAAAALAGLLALPAAGARAQDAGAAAVKELAPVTIHQTKNPGDLRYANFLRVWKFLLAILPPEPRVLDPRYRLSFTDLSGPDRDAFLPDTWSVAIVGDSFDHPIEVERGGYFVLPELERGIRENATIMFNARTRKGYLDLAWKFRVGAGQVLAYADFAQAFAEVATFQGRISPLQAHLRDEKNARFDGLKACFLQDGGRIEIDGRPAATVAAGRCRVLKFDPAVAAAGQARIAFLGQLDTVTLHAIVP